MLTNTDFITRAAAHIASVQTPHGVMADVGCCLESGTGEIFYGVCVGRDAGSICAERTAIATMITATRIYQIRRIVAVWKDTAGTVFVIPPCGSCRQFMHDMHPENIHTTQVILDIDRAVPLSTLLPFHDWWHAVEISNS